MLRKLIGVAVLLCVGGLVVGQEKGKEKGKPGKEPPKVKAKLLALDAKKSSITVEIDEMGLREGRPEDKPLLDVFASMIVERDSQKGIMIGHKGEHLREVGTRARHQISALLGTPVHLDLKVKVLKDWQRDPKYLNRLGF